MKHNVNRLSDRIQRRVGTTNARLLVMLALMITGLGLLEGSKLFGVAGLQSMGFQLPELGFLALAMMIPMLSGGIDLSIIATANLCALTVAWTLTALMPLMPDSHGVSWGMLQVGALVAGLLVAALVGLLNGVLVAYLRVPPMLATLGTMTAAKGLAIGFSHGNVISGFPAPIVFIGNGTLLGIPVALIIFAAVVFPLSVFVNKTPLGSAIAMIGSNERAAEYSGVNTRRSLVWVYLISALLAGVAGIIMMARFDSANAAYGESYLLVAILAAVLGGVDPLGGFGRVSGVILSLLILQLMSTASILLDLSQFITLALWGAILLLASGGLVLREWMSERSKAKTATRTRTV
ncbi:MAG TPA: ABC transporter permease [Erwinia persicina]|uniref:ABC transporter permease n=2 Tax=Erwinia persicina TaxID=55211 RepID=A0A3S7S1I2_9GAMM|nr:ABC transporter permease [Erwinia persicina]AXU94525.1 ABC transporter permease [Erwinia persicina]MBC3946984.1 ABC transporter permease [Erwinia persicina]MBD8105523.1 ABC transporter permease [Erwinia persicina]MBD8163409.1 ABC transporter permease [Erwinia persicina]MBD8167338.1 ABC transporter permease [Erwinia persicina]